MTIKKTINRIPAFHLALNETLVARVNAKGQLVYTAMKMTVAGKPFQVSR